MKPHVLKVPFDSGHRCERMARGPGYLLSNGVLAGAPVKSIETAMIAEVQCAFDLNRQISRRVREITEAGDFPILLSGNCNSALGTVSGLGAESTGILWFDAHGEFNTPETTRSGFFDGMPLAIATGRCWRRMAESIPNFSPVPERNIILVGARDTDAEEQAALDASGITQVRNPEMLGEVMDEAAPRVQRWYIHLDLDALDPGEATANQWVPPGGLTARGIAKAIEEAAQRLPIGAAAIASLDPACDGDGRALAIARELLRVTIESLSSR